MVSGIGPSHTLAQYDIPVLSDRPGVGQNMWVRKIISEPLEIWPKWITHLSGSRHFWKRLSSRCSHAQRFAESSVQCTASGTLPHKPYRHVDPEWCRPRWLGKAADSLRSTLSNETLAELDKLPSDRPEIEFLFLDAYSGNMTDLLTGAPMDGKMYCSSSAGLIAPVSRGNVTINST